MVLRGQKQPHQSSYRRLPNPRTNFIPAGGGVNPHRRCHRVERASSRLPEAIAEAEAGAPAEQRLRGGVCDALSDPGAALRSLDGFGARRLRHIVGFVLRRRLQGQETTKVPLDLGTIRASLSEQSQDLAVILSGSTLAEPSAADRIRGIDPCMHGQARRCDETPRFEFACGGVGKLLRFASVRAYLRGADGSGPRWLRHTAAPQAGRAVGRKAPALPDGHRATTAPYPSA